MEIRLLRAFFTLTTFAVVWLVTAPALALSDPEPARVRELSGGIGGLPRLWSATLTSARVSAAMSTIPPAPVDNAVPPTSRAPLCDPRGATTFAPPPQM